MKTSIKFYPSPRSTKGAIQIEMDAYDRWQPLSDEIVGVTLATFEQAFKPVNKLQSQTADAALWSHQYQIVTVFLHGNLCLSYSTIFRIQTSAIQKPEKQNRSVRDKFDSLVRKRRSGREAEHFYHLIQAIPEAQNACWFGSNWVREIAA